MSRTREPYPIHGIKAHWNGTCWYCDTDIRGHMVTRHGNNWAHVACHEREHQ